MATLSAGLNGRVSGSAWKSAPCLRRCLMLWWARRENLRFLLALSLGLIGNASMFLYFRNCRGARAKVEWHPGELYPRVGFIVTNLSRPADRVVAFYNKRGTCEQWIKEGKGAIKWTRLSCRTFAANAVRLQLHALAYNLGNFLRTLATPEPIKD